VESVSGGLGGCAVKVVDGALKRAYSGSKENVFVLKSGSTSSGTDASTDEMR